jgi:glycosyltransferase involved in cell wall biosynthesis
MENIKKIAFIWEQISYGGVESYLKYLIESKPFSNYKIVIISNSSNEGAIRLQKILVNKNLVDFKFYFSINITPQNFFFKIIHKALHPIFFFFSIIQMYFLIKKFKFDIIVGQCGGYGSLRTEMAAMISAQICKIPVKSMVIHHECLPSILWQYFNKIINYYLSSILDSVITVSEATKKSITNKSNILDKYSKLTNLVIYPGYPNITNINNKYLNDLYSKFISKNKIGIVSRIERNKGHEDLIYAISKINHNLYKHFKVFFIGKGEDEEIYRLKKIINNLNLEELFVFTGYISEKSQSIIASLDLLVSVSRRFEGFGSSIAEALSVATPVLTTNVGAIPEYLNNKYAGIVRPNNKYDIALSLEDFLNNKNKWIARAQLAQNYFYDNFHIDKIASQYVDHFQSILNQINNSFNNDNY